jgi:hypothetical protein
VAQKGEAEFGALLGVCLRVHAGRLEGFDRNYTLG